MCGILALLGTNHISDEELNLLKKLISDRGPDFCSKLLQVDTKCYLRLRVLVSVLHMRGDDIQEQPFIDEDGNVLAFNGQIYRFGGQTLIKEECDTKFLAEKLQQCKSKDQIANSFALIDGPFAFVYWSSQFKSLFCGRDIFGRKSLCTLSADEKIPAIISSTAFKLNTQRAPISRLGTQLSSDLTWSEVSTIGFHCWDFSQVSSHDSERKLESDLNRAETISHDIITSTYVWDLDKIYPKTDKCSNVSQDNHFILLKTVPLLPINFDNTCPKDFSEEDRSDALNGLEKRFLDAVSKRIQYDNLTCLECRQRNVKYCSHPQIAVAFSGGLDSTLIALALDKTLEQSKTIALVNVAFKDNSKDRISAGEAFKELKKLCPNRVWYFITCNISSECIDKKRNFIINHLILPRDTVIDDSLGCACWFIGLAQGFAMSSKDMNTEFDMMKHLEFNLARQDDGNPTAETHLGAVSLFVGSGIDEQLGGYSSHRSAWYRNGYQGVNEEICHQMRRISSRNLGRDDRVYSSHGRDVKLPFLDFDLVSYLNELPVGLKMNIEEPICSGPKKLLRGLALRWGLEGTSRRVKKALQFGTGIVNSREKGNDVCYRLYHV